MNIIPQGYILLLEAKDGKERNAYHSLAEAKGLKHISARTKYFDDVRIYKCLGCNKSYYIDELDTGLDWSITSPGMCYGVEINCKVCYNNNEELIYQKVLRGKKFLNTVIIGTEIPTIPRKYQRRKKYPKKNGVNICIPKNRGMILIPLEKFKCS